MAYSKSINGSIAQIAKGAVSSTNLNYKSNTTIVANTLPVLASPVVTQKNIVDYSNFDTSTVTNQNSKIYEVHTGMSENQPSIILTSKFLPIFENGKENSLNKSLRLKEVSYLLSTKNSIATIQTNKNVVDFVKKNESSLLSYILSEDYFIKNLISDLSKILGLMNINSWRYFDNGANKSFGFVEILESKKYQNSKKFSNSKIWQQFLVDLKFDLISHTRDFLSSNNENKNDDSEFDLLGLSPNSLHPEKRIWINPYYSNVLTESNVTRFEEKNIDDNVNALIGLQQNLYINIGESSKNEDGKSKWSAESLKNYSDVRKDISIIANSIAKEQSYSAELTKNSKILYSNYGYLVDDSGAGNIRVWDSLVGKFKKSVLDIPDITDNSLSSFSHYSTVAANGDQYKVLTFENKFIDNKPVTPGSYYFIDSTLATPDGKNFDSSRISILSQKLTNASSTIDIISKFCGHDPEEELVVDSSTLVDQVSKKFDFVKNTYVKMLSTNSKILKPLNFVTNFNSILNRQDKVTRFAAAIAKIAAYPTQNYSYQFYQIKSLLFLMILNAIFLNVSSQKSNQTSTGVKFNSKTIDAIRKKLINVIRSSKVVIESEEDYTRFFSQGTLYSDYVVSNSSNTNSISNISNSSSASEIFDLETGVWRAVFDIMNQAYTAYDVFGSENSEYTRYSAINKIVYLFAYFDLVLRVVASMTPDSLKGYYSYSPLGKNDEGFLLDQISGQNIATYYKKNSFGYSNPYIESAKSFLDTEKVQINSQIGVLSNYISQLNKSINDFSTFLSQNFENHLNNVVPFYADDKTLNDDQKNALLNLSLSEEQLLLSSYISSEYYDKLNEQGESESKINSLPFFTDLNSGFTKYLPNNDINVLSNFILTPYFNSSEFLGSNKRVLSVGIPPKLIRKISSTSTLDDQDRIRKNIIKIKLYKIDSIYPNLVYKPQEFIFELLRFPTRVIGNWEIGNFLKNSSSFLDIPTKFYGSRGQFTLNKNYSDAFREHGNFLSESEKINLYSNHAKSFLIEEYLKWFTGVEFDDSVYYRYTQLDDLTRIEKQYEIYSSLVAASTTTTSTGITAIFKDNSGNIIATQPGVSLGSQKTNVVKSTSLDLTDSIKSFFTKDTMINDINEYKRKISYPKKFDRIFNLIFDTNQFFVDENYMDDISLENLKQTGLIEGNKGNYRHRTATTSDINLDEYFVTVESFDLNG